MAVSFVFSRRSVFLATLCCTCVAFSVGSPTRRQSITINTETSSSEPMVVTNRGVWEDSDDFDLDGEGWLKQPSSPSSSRRPVDYEDYDDYVDENVAVDDFGDDDEDDNEDARGESEFLFLPPRETRLVQSDDSEEDDEAAQIKVRHTGRGSFSKSLDEDVKVHRPIDVTSDDDEDSISLDSEHHDEDDDSVQVLPRQEVRHQVDDEDDNSEEEDDVFDSPEEEASEVIYGDHVFLY